MNTLVTVKFTFVRHAESVDNLQAEVLAMSFSDTTLTAIHASPLERAFLTAKALQAAQPDSVPLETSPLLREQNFGLGEGQRYDVRRQPHLSFDEHIARGIFIPAHNRSKKYPDGESLNDVAARADTVVRDIILPYVQRAAADSIEDVHVAIVSHGIFISELITSLASQAGQKIQPNQFRGMKNTGWTLVAVKTSPGWKNDRQNGLAVEIIEQNWCKHLDALVRQKGGIGSATYDPGQMGMQ
ncbi:hypothetical protein H0H92_002212 [Tricholoma furcatifolium]|nr:hypothetical protein H0H92_002212 [Tricholoma furcatifolium]